MTMLFPGVLSHDDVAIIHPTVYAVERQRPQCVTGEDHEDRQERCVIHVDQGRCGTVMCVETQAWPAIDAHHPCALQAAIFHILDDICQCPLLIYLDNLGIQASLQPSAS